MYLSDRAKFLGSNYICKVLSDSTHPCYNSVNNFLTKYKNSKLKRKRVLEVCINAVSSMVKGEIGTTCRKNLYEQNIKDLISPINIDLEFGRTLQDSPCSGAMVHDFCQQQIATAIFTDGSLVPGHPSVGCEIHSPHDELNFPLLFLSSPLYLRLSCLP